VARWAVPRILVRLAPCAPRPTTFLAFCWWGARGGQAPNKLQYSSEIIGEGVRIRSMHDCMMQASYGFIRFEAIVLVKCDGGGPKWKTACRFVTASEILTLAIHLRT
jgi:hypothetical protein